MDVINHTPGYSRDTFNTFVDIIDPIVQSMWITKEEVDQAFNVAVAFASTKSLAFHRIVVAPTRSLPLSEHDSEETLKAFIRETRSNGSGKVAMVHTKNVDFSSGQPTCITRTYTQASITVSRKGPAVALISSIPNQLELVRVDTHLHRATGEVRHVLFKDPITGQDQEVDIMLCDTSICPDCQTTSSPKGHTDYREFMGYPLIHQKDVVVLDDNAYTYAPTDLVAVSDTPPTTKKEVHEVDFNVIFEGQRSYQGNPL